jgi:hypothetical protein
MVAGEDHGAMFLIECPSCQRRSLVGYARLVALANSSTGPVALVHCACGEPAAVDYAAARRPDVEAPA